MSRLLCHLGVTLRRLSGRRYADGVTGALLVASVVHQTHSGLLSVQHTAPHLQYSQHQGQASQGGTLLYSTAKKGSAAETAVTFVF